MAVKLKDAKITVKIDFQKSKKDADSLEERTKRQRREGEKEDKKQKKRTDKFEKAKRAGSVVRGAVGAGLYQAVAQIARSLPFGVGAAAAGGIAAAELNERFGPLIQGIIEERFSKDRKMVEFLYTFIVSSMGPAGMFVETDPSGASAQWSKLKAELSSIGAGLESGLKVGAADVLTGGTFTREEFNEVFGLTREWAKAQTLLEKARRRMRNRLVGEGIARSAEKAIKDAFDAAPAQK